MLEIFLCCSPADREVAAAISARLRDAAEAMVVLDDTETGSVVAKWEGGLSSTAILLLLSPEAVPPLVNRTSWGTLLDHITSNADPPIGSVLVRDCGYPRILERKRFFRWHTGQRHALRAIEKWAMELHSLPEQRSFSAARLAWFEGREDELDMLWETLVDRAGTAVIFNPAPASGKTSLAQEFARRAAAHFRDILWIGCGDRSPASIAAHLANQIDVNWRGETGEALAGLMDLAGKHRVLIVFDDVQPTVAIPDRQGRASLLVTTRSMPINASPAAHLIRIDTNPELPLAVPDNPVDLRLWRAMAACCAGGFPLELAVRIAGIEPIEAQASCERLMRSRLVDPVDDVRGWLRLSASSIAAAGDLAEIRRRHAEIVHEIISGWAKEPDSTKQYVAEFMPAFRWAADHNWALAPRIIRHAFAFLRHHGRLAEGGEMLVALRDAADERCDWEVSDECSWELSWIRGLPYRRVSAPIDGTQLDLDFSG